MTQFKLEPNLSAKANLYFFIIILLCMMVLGSLVSVIVFVRGSISVVYSWGHSEMSYSKNLLHLVERGRVALTKKEMYPFSLVFFRIIFII